MARRLAWIAGILAVVASLAAAYAAYVLAGYSWSQVVDYRSPFADYELGWVEQMKARPAVESQDTSTSPRVVLVLVDGLTLQASRDLMGSLNTARQYGADMVAVTPQPSLSYPTWTNVLTGAPPDVSGVTTNWFEGRVPVETVFDAVYPRPMVISATEDFDELYAVRDVTANVYLEPWDDTRYLGGVLVDEALRMAEDTHAALTFVYIPDADTIAHDNGPESDAYAEVVTRIDRDIQRLVEGMQDDRTLFVVTADHGHVDGGGHGGWETPATRVPAVFFGPGARYESGVVSQSDIAPTVAAFLDADVPTWASGRVLDSIVDVDPVALADAQASYRLYAERYARLIDDTDSRVGGASTYDEIDRALSDVRTKRLEADRDARMSTAALVAAGALAVLLVVALLSWRALLATIGGTAAYYAVYNALYFLVHGHQWSLSAFNTETYVEAFFNVRMAEAAGAGLVAVLVSAAVYAALRRDPKGPSGPYLGGWLSLGPATVLVVQATIAAQVAWFLWAWGAEVTWRLPDLKWGFKYDLDLIQVTALGAAALLSPLVTYLVGRYHPKVRRAMAVSPAEEPPPADA